MPALISQPSGTSATPSAQLDAHLADLLTSLDVYASTQAQASESFSKGFMQLARARLSLGAHGWTSLGGDGWDGRRVRAAVRVRCDERGGVNVVRVKVEPEETDAEQAKAAGSAEKAQPDASGLRRRGKGAEAAPSAASGPSDSASKDEDEDPTGKLKSLSLQSEPKASKRKPSTDPIDQFAALPPPTLRSAQKHFREALGALLGAPTTSEEGIRENSLGVLGRFRELESRIEEARKKIEEEK